MDREGPCSELPETDVVLVNNRYVYMLHDLKTLHLDPAAGKFAAVLYGHTHVPNFHTARASSTSIPAPAAPDASICRSRWACSRWARTTNCKPGLSTWIAPDLGVQPPNAGAFLFSEISDQVILCRAIPPWAHKRVRAEGAAAGRRSAPPHRYFVSKILFFFSLRARSRCKILKTKECCLQNLPR